MVNPRVEKAVGVTLDFCDLIMTPRRWSTKTRRAYVMTFPLSFPLFGVVCILIMALVMLAAGVCGVFVGLCSLSDYFKKLWEPTP